jgi:hypothetical protein
MFGLETVVSAKPAKQVALYHNVGFFVNPGLKAPVRTSGPRLGAWAKT